MKYAIIVFITLLDILCSLSSEAKDINYVEIIDVIAKEENVPTELLASICFVETKFRPHLINYDDGHSDSLGFCQIKLSTARLVGYTGNRQELLKLSVNLRYAAKYLKIQMKRYGSSYRKSALAYNAGQYYPRKGKKETAINEAYWNLVKLHIPRFKSELLIGENL